MGNCSRSDRHRIAGHHRGRVDDDVGAGRADRQAGYDVRAAGGGADAARSRGARR